MKRTVLSGVCATLLVSTGCSFVGAEGETEQGDVLSPIDPGASLTAAGADLAEPARLSESAPRYHVSASVTPESGLVEGTVHAELPVGADVDRVQLRYFAGLPSFKAEPSIGDVEVDGEAAEASRDDSIVTVDLPSGHDDRAELEVPFSYTLPRTEDAGGLLGGLLGGGGLTPADIGLLSRRQDVVNLGHWFPLWIPEGGSAQPVPDGFGDIGNFPAAMFSLELSVPEGWTVIDGGVRTGEDEDGDRVTVRSEGAGMRDLVASVVRGYTSKSRELDGALAGVTVSAHGPKSAKGELDAVLDETASALEELSSDFGAYPWQEFDVVSAPLGSGVAGMEWPGAVWIETSMFAGGIPGLGGLEGLEGLGGLEGLEGLEGLLGEGGSLLDDLSLTMRTAREWIIAHEVGHEWWHILVGNDSVLHPVVDEPLAQYSACRVLRGSVSASDGGAVCEAHIESGYTQMRMLGTPDAAAARRTDAFASSSQYAGLVYGKAAAFYLALEEEFGRDAVADALRQVVAENAFEMMSGDELHAALAEHLGDADRVDRMWRHWMKQTHGDADLGAPRTSLGGGQGGDLDSLLENLPKLLDDALSGQGGPA